ncbi:MAG TPA: serine/threonine-protein kinase [Streptosporangiaceae bacterium]|nr:serine/threonine-protein kinase [Streptosporangiaceae bacterium]
MDSGAPGELGSVGGYSLLSRLGAGGMGQVFLGESPGGRLVAVKVIHPALAADEQFRLRFAREVDAARRVGGFHTAPVVDADPYADPPWMVTAYIDGPSLQLAVDRDGPLPPERVRRLGAGLAEGLAAIHACALVHRDLKPGNVIMAADGPRIIDFGIARAAGASALTSAGVVVGTFGYMSPELLRGEAAGPASDVFALGCVLAFAATGRPPFGDDLAAAVMFRIISEAPDLEGLPDDDLLQLITGCLAKAPAGRPSVDAILTALTGRVPGPASRAVPVAGPAAVPVTGSAAVAAPTGPGQYAQLPSRTAPPRPPGPPGGPRARRPRRRRTGALIGAGTAVAAVAAALPFLLTTHHPQAAAGYTPSAGPGVISRAAAHGSSSPHPASPGPGRPSTSRPSTGSPGPKPVPTSAVAPVDVTFHGSGDPSFFDVAFSPDGRMVAAAGGVTAGAFVWDIATGRLITLADPERSGVSEVAFSPDGKLLATADGDDSEYLWAMPSGTLIATLTRPNAGGAPYGMAFSPDGRLLAVGEGAFQTDLWDVTTRTLLYNLKDSDGISGVAFSPDDKLLASSGGPAFLWNVASGQRVASLYDDPGTKSGVNDVAFSPDGTRLATVDTNGHAYLWDVAARKVAARFTPPGLAHNLRGVAFSPDGTLVAIASDNGRAYLWNIASGTLAGTLTDPSHGSVSSVAFSPDGKMLAICDDNGNVYVRVTSELAS